MCLSELLYICFIMQSCRREREVRDQVMFSGYWILESTKYRTINACVKENT